MWKTRLDVAQQFLLTATADLNRWKNRINRDVSPIKGIVALGSYEVSEVISYTCVTIVDNKIKKRKLPDTSSIFSIIIGNSQRLLLI